MNPRFRKMLVPVDYSPPSTAAIRYAVDLARAFDGTVHVLHAWEVPAYVRPDLTIWSGEMSATLGEQVRLGAENAMREFSKANGLDRNDAVTCEVVQGGAYNAILTVAKDGDFDLIVMGTHGRTGISHVLLGSVAEKVVRHANCPVLTIRATAEGSRSRGVESSGHIKTRDEPPLRSPRTP